MIIIWNNDEQLRSLVTYKNYCSSMFANFFYTTNFVKQES